MQATNRCQFTSNFVCNPFLLTLPRQFSGNSTNFKFANKQTQATVNSRVQLEQKQTKIRAHEKLPDKTSSVNDACVRTQKQFGKLMANFQTQRQSQDLDNTKSRSTAQKSNCGFDKASKLFNKILTTVSLRWPPTLQTSSRLQSWFVLKVQTNCSVV